jgi:hypothetical protein
VDHAFGNALVIEVEDLLSRDLVFQQLRSARTGGEPVLTVRNRMTLRSCHHIIVALGLLMVRTALGEFEFFRHGCFPFDPVNRSHKKDRRSRIEQRLG